MAFATHLTLATGHDLPLGEGDEMQNRQEMQRISVSITYELERGDLDVPLLATVKASELAQAHRAAAEVLRAHAFVPHVPVPPPPCFTAPGLHQTGTEAGWTNGAGLDAASSEDEASFHAEDPDEDDLALERMDAEAPFDEAEAPFVPLGEDKQEPFIGSQAPTYQEWIAGDGTRRPDQSPSPDQAPSPGQEVSPSQASPPGQTAGGQTPTSPLLTPPKRLAIQSLASKIGLTPPEFSSLLRERFGVWSLHLLTKEQGEALHRALQDGLKEKQDREKQDCEAAAPPAFVTPHASASPSISSAHVSPAHNGRTASASGKAVRSH